MRPAKTRRVLEDVHILKKRSCWRIGSQGSGGACAAAGIAKERLEPTCRVKIYSKGRTATGLLRRNDSDPVL